MDSESQKMLEETYSLTKENNDILRAIRRSMRWSQFMSVVYWLIIIGVSIGAFYYFQPYFDKLMNVYGSLSNVLKNIK